MLYLCIFSTEKAGKWKRGSGQANQLREDASGVFCRRPIVLSPVNWVMSCSAAPVVGRDALAVDRLVPVERAAAGGALRVVGAVLAAVRVARALVAPCL